MRLEHCMLLLLLDICAKFSGATVTFKSPSENLVLFADEDEFLGKTMAIVEATSNGTKSDGTPASITSTSVKDTADSDVLKLSSISGSVAQLSLNKQLDYETRAGPYIIELIAIDNAEPVDTGSVTVTLSVRDINDNTPEFPDSLTGSVYNSATVGTVVGTFAASDADGTAPNNVITYSITDGDDNRPRFVIDPSSATISTSGQCLTAGNEYILQIKAQDGGRSPRSYSASAAVTINVVYAPTTPVSAASSHVMSPCLFYMCTLLLCLWL